VVGWWDRFRKRWLKVEGNFMIFVSNVLSIEQEFCDFNRKAYKDKYRESI